MSESVFKFTPPPEAPVFYPTLKEFEDPLEYLEKIRPTGLKTGICKIIPPQGWSPPFAVDVNTFRFRPRVQRLYEMEAVSRLKMDFINRLFHFYRLQGFEKTLIPNIGGRFLDVYYLYKHVVEAGGYDKVSEAKLWPQMAEKLGYSGPKFANTIKTNYYKLLYKYEMVMNTDPVPKERLKRSGSVASSQRSTPVKRTRLHATEVCEDDTKIDYTANKELKNLQYFGAGPKAVVPIVESAAQKTGSNDGDAGGEYLCRVCDRGDNEASLLICAGCEGCYHTYCLRPPLPGVPPAQPPWRCPVCVRRACSRPIPSLGFDQAPRSYSLAEFGHHADAFKAKYFHKQPTSVSCAEVETEYWRILQEYEEDVAVEYGADVRASDQGSGFPTELQIERCPHLFSTPDLRRQALEYARSPWNLNNLPLYGNSVLRFIKGSVDGMKVPWCYVGMVFSTFCWHIEDHWSCSINFNHWGEPKTWYGVAPADAERFEHAMHRVAGELFEASPDLLHHITTTLNPNVLQAQGVPIYRTDQHCGEFVVTFPRAYHAGFNQGFNFAEAVNVCPPAWLPTGRECVEHYAQVRRQCVFSNDELLFRLAQVIAGQRSMSESATYTAHVAQRFRDADAAVTTPTGRTFFSADDLRVIHAEFANAVAREARARRRLTPPHTARSVRLRRIDRLFDSPDEEEKDKGDVEEKEEEGEDEDDDIRVCAVCQTTLFFSAVACPCKLAQMEAAGMKLLAPSCADGKPKGAFLVCPEHAESVCSEGEGCKLSTCTLFYTHSIEELEALRDAVATRMSAYVSWRETFEPFFTPSFASTQTQKQLPAAARIPLEVFETTTLNADDAEDEAPRVEEVLAAP